MKVMTDSNQIKNLIIGFAILGAIFISSCAKQTQTVSNVNQTSITKNDSNKVKDIPKSTPTIEVVEKTDSKKPEDLEDIPDKSADTKSNKVKLGGIVTNKLTKENFDKINIGMTHEEVTKIFDDKGMQTSEMHINGHDSDMFMWSNDNYTKRINVTFEKNKVTEKTQSGL